MINQLEEAKQRLKEIEDLKNNGFYDKIKFMEGASWMCEKVIKEIEKFDQMETSIIQEFEE